MQTYSIIPWKIHMSHFTTSKKFHSNPWGDEHPEKLSDTPSKSIGWDTQLKGLINPSNYLDQMFGGMTSESYYSPQKAERKSSKQEFLVFSHTKTEEDKTIQQESAVLIQELKQQITQLEKAEKGFSREISKIKVAQLPKEGGVYYLRFFEWLITMVKQLRLKIEDGQVWLKAFQQQKKKKIGYWQKYKKHGTTFGLSHERSLATQTG